MFRVVAAAAIVIVVGVANKARVAAFELIAGEFRFTEVEETRFAVAVFVAFPIAIAEVFVPTIVIDPVVPDPDLIPVSIVIEPEVPEEPEPAPVAITIAPELFPEPTPAPVPIVTEPEVALKPSLVVPEEIVIAPEAVVLFAVEIGKATPAAEDNPVSAAGADVHAGVFPEP
jgi:hypothetical protein